MGTAETNFHLVSIQGVIENEEFLRIGLKRLGSPERWWEYEVLAFETHKIAFSRERTLGCCPGPRH